MIVMEGVIYSLFLSEAQISLPLQILLWDAICIYIHTHTIGEGNGDPLQYSCLESSVDGGAWWAAIHRVSQSRTRLKRLSSSSSITVLHWRHLNFSNFCLLGWPQLLLKWYMWYFCQLKDQSVWEVFGFCGTHSIIPLSLKEQWITYVSL